MKRTKKEWVEWFKSLDDDAEIELVITHGETYENGKLKRMVILF